MKAFFIALFVLTLNISLAVVAETNLFPDVKMDYYNSGTLAIKQQYESLADIERPIKDADDTIVTEDSQDKDKGSNLFSVLKHTLFPNTLLTEVFGIDSSITIWCLIPIYLFYIIGIAQLWIDVGGRNAI